VSGIECVNGVRGKQRLREFIAAFERVSEEAQGDEALLLRRGSESLQILVRHDDWLEEKYALSSRQRYQQYLIYCDPLLRFSIVSFVWGPGQRTPIHDHTTWGLIGMLRGIEISQSYEFIEGTLVAGKAERLVPGEVTMVSPTIGDIHCVRNAVEDGVSISIHVYGGDIGSIERHMYTPDGGSKSFVSGYANRAPE
jgi:predicted metal-dependent enzyme (double-stranded beta helix superfamily)